LKILGIDDTFAVNELLETVLNGSGYDFMYVNNGKDGLKLIEAKKFDLVLLDLAMPEFTGLDVIKSLEDKGLLGKQKIILFTASALSDNKLNEILNKGIHSYIRKPIDIDVLLQKIDELENH